MKFKSDIEIQAGLKDKDGQAGSNGQILASTGSQVDWIDPAGIVTSATDVIIECKNTSGATIAKGTPVYQTGNVGATAVIEVAVADASDEAKMAAIGLLQSDLINNAFGYVVVTGELLNITTSPIDGTTPSIGDTIYVKPGGGLTLTKPTGVNFIQNVGLVGKVSGGNAGSLTVSSIMRSNDVPTPLYVDHTNQRLGIGTTSPSHKLTIAGTTTHTTARVLTTTGNANLRLSTNNSDFSIIGQGGSNRFDIFDVNGNSTRLSINSSGNVGIGTTSPSQKLDIVGGNLRVNSETGREATLTGFELQFSRNSFNYIYATDSAGSIRIVTGGNAQGSDPTADFKSNKDSIFYGNVGIGTTSPSYPLEIAQAGYGLGVKNLITSTDVANSILAGYYAGTVYLGYGYGSKEVHIGSTNSGDVKIRTLGNTIVENGNVGIGSTSPSASLEVVGSVKIIAMAGNNTYPTPSTKADNLVIENRNQSQGDAGITIFSDNGALGGVYFGDEQSNQVTSIINDNTGGKADLYFTTNGNNERMRITSSGNVGIGTTSPNYPLVVNGVAAANRFYIPNVSSTSAWALQARNSANTADSGLYFENGDAQLLLRDDGNNLNVRINSDTNSYINGGNLGIGTTTPDARLTSFRNVSSYAVSRGDVSTRAGLSVKSSSNYDSKLNFATGLNSQQYIQGLNNAATTGRPIVLNPYGGYVGINTANLPTQQLDIISGTNNGIRISATDDQTWRDIGIRSYVTEGQANALANHTFIYTTNPSSGTEDPFRKYGATVIQGRDNGHSGFAIRLGNGGGHATRMWMGATGVTTFSNTVTATNFILSSDSRLKDNVEDVDNSHVDVDWKTFEMKEHEGQKRYGVIAQELEEKHPEFVRTDDKGMKSVAYVDLLIAKIAELEARLEKLEK